MNPYDDELYNARNPDLFPSDRLLKKLMLVLAVAFVGMFGVCLVFWFIERL